MQKLHVNRAHQKKPREDCSSHFHLYIGHVASDVSNKMLSDAFSVHGCSDARVIVDHNTGYTKGYGFVAFK